MEDGNKRIDSYVSVFSRGFHLVGRMNEQGFDDAELRPCKCSRSARRGWRKACAIVTRGSSFRSIAAQVVVWETTGEARIGIPPTPTLRGKVSVYRTQAVLTIDHRSHGQSVRLTSSNLIARPDLILMTHGVRMNLQYVMKLGVNWSL